ncbi:MAG: hypothetical protein K0U39_03305 [Alphaproteobacteria bacterium]|nr:hypothetical protein [Alphaproteobacteria bacterium]
MKAGFTRQYRFRVFYTVPYGTVARNDGSVLLFASKPYNISDNKMALYKRHHQ